MALPPLSGLLVEVKTGVPAQVRVVRREQVEGDRARGVEAAGLLWLCPRWRCRTGPPAEGVVEIVGVAWAVVTGSAAQSDLTVVLLASPL